MNRMKMLVAAATLLAGSASAAPVAYYAHMDGPSEAPPNASPGTGFTRVTIDTMAHTLHVQAWFSGLLGTTTAAHIHIGVPTGPVATQTPSFSGFPLGVTSGSMDRTFDLTLASSFRAGFITASGGTVAGAEAALAAGMAAGSAYFNIHSTSFPGGEIRGFLKPAPEPSTIALSGLALAAAAFLRRRR
ncbi:MAG: CHRD domain-containing protein [Acidobacteria bacterium]|nr:CHRD domain-containing protein [Acidobacteriota bacterium]